MMICGIDEAGRGPVIGPIVMAGVTIEEKDEKNLVRLGVKDSKLLTPAKREELFSRIIAIIKDFRIEIIPPQKIDAALNDPDLNLNWLEALESAKIIDTLKPDKAILDCPSNNIKAYSDYVKKRLKTKCRLVCEHKADEKYPSCSAASILAKVTRDKEIQKIKERLGQDIGSGYPSDPITKEFLAKNYSRYPGIFRKTWASYRKFVSEKGQKTLKNF